MKSFGWRLTLSATLLAGCKSSPAVRPTALPTPSASTPAPAPVVPVTRLPPTAPFTDVRLVSASEPLPGEVRRLGSGTVEMIAPAPWRVEPASAVYAVACVRTVGNAAVKSV